MNPWRIANSDPRPRFYTTWKTVRLKRKAPRKLKAAKRHLKWVRNISLIASFIKPVFACVSLTWTVVFVHFCRILKVDKAVSGRPNPRIRLMRHRHRQGHWTLIFMMCRRRLFGLGQAVQKKLGCLTLETTRFKNRFAEIGTEHLLLSLPKTMENFRFRRLL